jgi:hypothetical protein
MKMNAKEIRKNIIEFDKEMLKSRSIAERIENILVGENSRAIIYALCVLLETTASQQNQTAEDALKYFREIRESIAEIDNTTNICLQKSRESDNEPST